MPHPFAPKPVTLRGQHVRLEPLGLRHLEGLYEAGRPESVWTHLSNGPFQSAAEAKAWIEAARATADIPFAVLRERDGQVVGSTRFLDIRPKDRGLEIGWTWLTPSAQRTACNTEQKYLMLRHAFEELGAIRVQLKTDILNLRSQAAIARLGATREGVLRQQMIRGDGSYRDSVMFSIVDSEWAGAKGRLEKLLLSRPGSG